VLRLLVPVQMHTNRFEAVESRVLIVVAAGKRQYASSGENGSGRETNLLDLNAGLDGARGGSL
jgi:hypothetical protein